MSVNNPRTRVSIILSVYNGAKYLRSALDSVLKQTVFPEIEFLCMDDGSTDESSAILHDIANTDSRVRLFWQPNQGLGVARTRLLKEAKGDYLMFLDADDKLASGAVLAQGYEQVVSDDLDVLISAGALMTESGKVLGKAYISSELIPAKSVFAPEDLGNSLYLLSYPGVCGKLFRRRFIHDNGFVFPAVRRSEDFPFLESALASAKRIGVLDKPFFLRRIGSGVSMEEKKDAYPTTFFESEAILRQDLKRRGLDSKFGTAVDVASVVRLWYNFSTMQTYEGSKAVFDKMKQAHRVGYAGFHDSHIKHAGYVAALQNVRVLCEYSSIGAYYFQKYRDTERQNRKLNADLRTANAKANTLETELGVKVCALNDVEQSCMRYRDEICLLKSSEAYRVGMFVTWPARKITGGIKCLRENDVKYTVKHFFGKIARRIGFRRVKW